jgi:hypothetical protein
MALCCGSSGDCRTLFCSCEHTLWSREESSSCCWRTRPFPVLRKPWEHGRMDLCSLVAAVHLKRTALHVWVMDNRVQVSSVQVMLWHHHRKFLFSPLFS